MFDTIAIIIGYVAILSFASIIVIGLLALLYFMFTATLDVASQYYLLWREKRKPTEGVTFWQAWSYSLSYQDNIWGRIWYRVRRAHGYGTTHPFNKRIGGG